MCCWVKSPSLVSLQIIFRTFQEIDNHENAFAGDKIKAGDDDHDWDDDDEDDCDAERL